ncbi:MAG: hypothetical protein ACRD0W_24855 [Acidimicrobiales bacterium]
MTLVAVHVEVSREIIDAGVPIKPLWHFTCGEHGYPGIGRRGVLEPRLHKLFPQLGPIVWLTDDPGADREALGLTQTFIRCDRMAYRYRVTPSYAVRWSDVRAALVTLRVVAPRVLADLEAGREPASWWLTGIAVPAVLA